MTKVDVASIYLLRDQLLPNLLKDDTDEILYWAGKELAREYDLDSDSALEDFFETHQFGTLTLIEKKKKQQEFLLTGDAVNYRLEKNKDCSFSLETGFLAEQIQKIHQVFSEGRYEVKVRKKEVHILIQLDAYEDISEY